MKTFIAFFILTISPLLAVQTAHQHNKKVLSKYNSVVVYQFGKVGSSSLRDFFKTYLPTTHTHTTEPINKLLRSEGRGKFLLINAMRNVFDRNLSCLSQHIKSGKVKMPKNYDIDDLVNFFPDFSRKEDSLLETWYENFNTLLGLHTFDQPFDFENKYYFESTDRYDVLILRYEDISRWPEIFNKVLNLRCRQLPPSNTKSIPLYSEFKKVARYPQSEIDYILSFDFMRHFYTPDELNSFVEKHKESSRANL